MPIKYKDTGMDLVNNTPLVDKLKETSYFNSTDDMMSDIISERTKMKATSMLNMIGGLTPILYYQSVPDSSNNYNTDASQPSSISFDTKKFIEIKNLKVKMTNSTAFDNDGEENDKSYLSSGSFIILPRTIQPNEGDMFIITYYGKQCLFSITSVIATSYEQDSGFDCQYVFYSNGTVPENQIIDRKLYRHELIGTTYRAILSSNEYENLKKFEKLDTHLSDVFNNLFYDRSIDSYILTNHEIDDIHNKFNDNNNINTLGKLYGDFRPNTQGYNPSRLERAKTVPTENKIYDNFLNTFIKNNKIFRNYNGLVLSVEPKFGEDRVCYKRSIFGCLESKSIANYKNTFVSTDKIDCLSPSINSYFVGKLVAKHADHPEKCGHHMFQVFPEALMTQLINGKSSDMNVKCTNLVYNSMDSLIIETIVRYIYNKTEDFPDRFNILYKNIDNLYEHDISYANIYYLFPMLGFVIERTLEEMYSDNISLN